MTEIHHVVSTSYLREGENPPKEPGKIDKAVNKAFAGGERAKELQPLIVKVYPASFCARIQSCLTCCRPKEPCSPTLPSEANSPPG